MERFNKKLLLITLLLGIFLLTGCNKTKYDDSDASKEDEVNTVTVVPDQKEEVTVDDNVSKDSNSDDKENASSPAKAEDPLADIELPIYMVSSEGELLPVTALVPDGSEITPELIVDKVIEALSDESFVIAIDSVSTENDKIIVSFKKDKAPDTNTASEVIEGNILNAFAQSLIDNVEDSNFKKVIFRIEGKPYTSDAFQLDLDEPYMQK